MLTLESCLNKVVKCADGGRRRLRQIKERDLVYEVPCKGGWIDMGDTPRRHAEHLFTNGVIDRNQGFDV